MSGSSTGSWEMLVKTWENGEYEFRAVRPFKGDPYRYASQEIARQQVQKLYPECSYGIDIKVVHVDEAPNMDSRSVLVNSETFRN